MSVPIARRQLLHRPGRTLAGLAGIAVALLLVLALKAIFAGMEQKLTFYIDRSGADVYVAQRGVDTMHMTVSALPARAVREIAAVAGVAEARPILYVATMVARNGRRGLAYLIGDDRGSGLPLVAGRQARAGEIVLDRELAASLGAGLGETVETLGRSFRVAGEIEGASSITNSVAFVRRADLGQVLKSPGVVSYVLVRTRPGAAAGEVAARIERDVPGVTATTRAAFARSERRVVGDMSTDIVRAMLFVGFVIGVAVAGLVAYSSTLAQLRDYALLRALGLRARRALALVLAQIGSTVAAGFALSLALVWLLGLLLPRLSATLVLSIRPGDVAQAFLVAGAVAAVAAGFPVLHVARVDPASVFRR